MAYEATVPVHRRLLWSAVTDPERLLGAVPNLVVEAGSEHGVAARLRLRAGEKSITFRGIARLVDLAPEELRAVVEVEAVHGRSDGSLDGRVVIRLRPDGDGTRIELEPDFVLSGHGPTIPPEQLIAAAERLIPRWFAQLAGSAPEPRPTPVPLTVVPEPAPALEPESEPPAEPGEQDEQEAEPGRGPLPEARPGPMFTLITGTGEAEDARPAAKAPLRLVASAEPERAQDLPEERDLWSERPGRFIAPLWVLGAAAAGSLGVLIALLRRRSRRRRAVR